MVVVVTEVEVALDEEVHELGHRQVIGNAQYRMALVEVVLGYGGALGVTIGHDHLGLGMQAANRQFIRIGVGVENTGLALGLFEEP